MDYFMVACKGENNKRSFQSPSSEMLDQAITDLIPAPYHFVILEADPPVGKCIYIQALIESEGKAKGRYLVEARYRLADHFKHYRMHTGDVGEVKTIFRAFVKGVEPNTAGWDDITGKLDSVTK